MKAKTISLLLAIAILFATGIKASALSEIITFDNITTNLSQNITSGYGGLYWTNFAALNPVLGINILGTNGYLNGIVSPYYVAVNGGGANALIAADNAFDLGSAYLTAAWRDGLQVEVQGFLGNTLTYDNTYTVNTQGPTLIDFNYYDVDRVNFIASGGVIHGGYNGAGTQFAMDNLSVTLNLAPPIPEPSTFALAGLAAVLLALRRLIPRRRLS